MTILDHFKMTDRVAIVTGAGRGIGRGIALGFAEAGAHVVCAARTKGDIEQVAAQVERQGGKALAVPCDVMVSEQLEQLVDQAVERFGRIDVLVNNAGGYPPSTARSTSIQMLEQAFHFNVAAAFRLSQLAMPRLREAPGSGAILNISSALSHLVEKGFVAYGTSKAALNHLTRLLAHELAPTVRVNALAVGAVETSALSPFLGSGGLREKMEALTPMGRIGTTEDVAAAALYLCSPAGSWVTGKVFEVDGGTIASNWPLDFSNL